MFFKKLAALIRQPNFQNALLWVSLGLGGGVLLWNGFMLSLDAYSTTEFCISCHSMKVYVYEDYKQSIHYRNTKGIQAQCADCHVPKPLGAKLVCKTIALNDVYHTILASIDTPEKFSAKKQHLAERVWERTRARDSQECRNCHKIEQMDLDHQSAVARKLHLEAKQMQKTCIDCHKGVAHKLANIVNNDHNSEESFSLE